MLLKGVRVSYEKQRKGLAVKSLEDLKKKAKLKFVVSILKFIIYINLYLYMFVDRFNDL